MIIGYKTVNLVNNKYYYGVHKCLSINDGYIGCGIKRQSDARLDTRFHTAVRKYGYSNFKRYNIKEFITYKDALIWERQTIDANMLTDPLCYNSKIGGKGGGQKWSKELKEKHTHNGTYKKTDDMKKKLSAAAIKRFENAQGTFTGKKHSPETRQLFSNQRKGKPNRHKGITLNLTDASREVLRRNMKIAHAAAVIANTKYGEDWKQMIRNEYTGKRGEKVILAKKHNCRVNDITNAVGKSYTHGTKVKFTETDI